LEYM